MNVEFRGLASDERHRDAVLIEGMVDGRPVHFRFTRDAVRSVSPSVTDGRDLLERLTSQADVFAAVVARKLRDAGGDTPDEITVTEADVLSAASGLTGDNRWSDDGGRARPWVNEYA